MSMIKAKIRPFFEFFRANKEDGMTLQIWSANPNVDFAVRNAASNMSKNQEIACYEGGKVNWNTGHIQM